MREEARAKTRRDFLASAAMTFAMSAPAFAAKEGKAMGHEEEEVSPVEDLMREHGLLNRLLLIYDHAATSLQSKQALDLTQVAAARDIVQSFIEGYHERLEEDHVFPHFEKAKKQTDLVATLRQQHQVGKALTESIAGSLKANDTGLLSRQLTAFTRMYRPHEAREDTVLFPEFSSLMPRKQYEELGEKFEELEHKLFGEAGFKGMVDKVATIEKALGIYELSQFTPKASL